MLTRRRQHRVMLSPTTLAAFSAGVTQTRLGQSGLVSRVRAAGAQQPQSTAPTAPATAAPTGRDGDTVPGRLLPRGSLLDLSV
jgi:hypothetical protein